MNRSYSKLRHIQESNRVLEERKFLNENIFSKLFGKEEEDLSKEDIEKQMGYMANLEFEIYDDYENNNIKKYKKLIHPKSSENEIYVDLDSFGKNDHFYKFIEPVKKYLADNGGMVELGNYIFNLDGNEIIINKKLNYYGI